MEMLKLNRLYTEEPAGDLFLACDQACMLQEWKRVRKMLASQVFRRLPAAKQQDTMNLVLWRSSHSNQLAMVKHVLHSRSLPVHADIRAQDEFGWNAFMWACHGVSGKVMKYLYGGIEDPSLKRKWLDDALTHGAKEGHMGLVHILMQGNILADKPDIHHNERGALRLAQFSGNVRMVNYMASLYPEFSHLQPYDERLNIKVFSFLQAHNVNLQEVQYLLKTVNFHCQKISTQQGQINDLLMQGCQAGNLALVEYLLACPEMRQFNIPAADVNLYKWHDGKYHTPLSLACEVGHLPIIRSLLQAGAALHAQDHLALITAWNNGHWHIVKYLLASPEITAMGIGHADIGARGNHCLNSACMFANLEMVKFLTSGSEITAIGARHADVYAEHGKALRLAFRARHDNVVNYLVFDYGMQLKTYMKASMDQEEDLKPLVKLLEARDLKQAFEEMLSNKPTESGRTKL